MRDAPAYSAERFPGDFAASAVCGLITAALVGPLTWWLARRYLEQTYPHHPEMIGAAVVTGLFDGVLVAVLAAGICFAVRVWTYERRERRQSDDALRSELEQIAGMPSHGSGADGEPPAPPR